MAFLKTNGLSLGNHKITIGANYKKYLVKKTSGILVTKRISKKRESLDLYAPVKTVEKGDNNYFYITVKNKFGCPLKGILLKVKVFSGNKYKNIAVKTNSTGVAKFKTNNLSLGFHRVIIKPPHNNYCCIKFSKIVVKSSENVFKPTKLISLKLSQKKNGNFSAKLSWVSKKKVTYQILRKSNKKFNVIATVKANSNEMSFVDVIDGKTLYTYSVRK